MSSPSKPLLLTFVCCDAVHMDPATGKYYLLGMFSGIRARQFPVVHPQMYWFITLTDVQIGEHSLKASLGMPGEPPLMQFERKFQSQSPVHRIHLINDIKNLQFSQPGDYSLVLEINDDLILATTFTVTY